MARRAVRALEQYCKTGFLGSWVEAEDACNAIGLATQGVQPEALIARLQEALLGVEIVAGRIVT